MGVKLDKISELISDQKYFFVCGGIADKLGYSICIYLK